MTLTRSLVALVALTALALTGCTNDPEQPGNGSGGSPTGEEPGQLSEADSPLRQYRDLIFGAGTPPNASPQERWRAYAEQQNQLNELIATCMSEQGFDYPVERINEEVVPTDLDGPAWEPESRDWVERYGYGLADYPGRAEVNAGPDAPEEEEPAMTEAEAAAFQEALFDASPPRVSPTTGAQPAAAGPPSMRCWATRPGGMRRTSRSSTRSTPSTRVSTPTPPSRPWKPSGRAA